MADGRWGALMIAAWIVAGLDYRFGWSGPVPLWVHLAGLLLTAGGYGIFLWAMTANAYFSEGVRIQSERGHAVQSDGPYRIVRHPGYVGGIMSYLGTPLLLGSWWAFIPTLALLGVWVARTTLEDRLLQEKLPGYAEYARTTRYRLVPGLW
ncbi:MAG: isoprenylcysteine carboxylmethyltransferase family protein [Chloroflexota bacterium]